MQFSPRAVTRETVGAGAEDSLVSMCAPAEGTTEVLQGSLSLCTSQGFGLLVPTGWPSWLEWFSGLVPLPAPWSSRSGQLNLPWVILKAQCHHSWCQEQE